MILCVLISCLADGIPNFESISPDFFYEDEQLQIGFFRNKQLLWHFLSILIIIKVSKSQKQILKFSFEPQMNENIYEFLP
jgi:hypothetical protein